MTTEQRLAESVGPVARASRLSACVLLLAAASSYARGQDLTISNGVGWPGRLEAGRQYTFDSIYKNAFLLAASSQCLSGYYVRRGQDDPVLLGTHVTPKLGPGKSHQERVTVTIPLDAPGGTVDFFGFVDCTNVVREVNENNNTYTIPRITLQNDDIAALDIGTTTPAAEFYEKRSVEVYVKVHNVGNLEAPASTAHIYLSSNNVISVVDQKLGEVGVPALKANEVATVKVTVTVGSTSNLPTKPYLGVILDGDKALDEWRGNNTASRQVTITSPPYLKFTYLRLDAPSAAWNTKNTARIRLQNIGGGTLDPGSGLTLYLNTDFQRKVHANTRRLLTRTLPAFARNEEKSVDVAFTVPAGVCPERPYELLAIWDNAWGNDTVAGDPFTPKWPTTPGYYVGQVHPTVSASSGDCGVCTTHVGTPAPNTFYLFLMSCSGSGPGISVPGIGTLHLNWDACTDIGFALHGSHLQNLAGILSGQATGSTGKLLGGPWIKPLLNRSLTMAALYINANQSPQLVGFSEKPSLTIKVIQ